MEILSAGAFINLENQEKIEQLKSTALELAKGIHAMAKFMALFKMRKSLDYKPIEK